MTTGFEVERFVENFFLKDPGADHLAVHRDKHFVFARGEDVNLRNLRFLMKLLGAELDRLARAMLPGFLQSRIQEHRQIRMIEIFRVAFDKRRLASAHSRFATTLLLPGVLSVG